MDACKTDTPSPEAILLRKGDAAAVHRALGGLPPRLREVIILREFEQLTYKEIAAIAGVPKGTVMSRLSRARKQLEWTLDGRLRTTTRRHSPPTRYKLWNQIV